MNYHNMDYDMCCAVIGGCYYCVYVYYERCTTAVQEKINEMQRWQATIYPAEQNITVDDVPPVGGNVPSVGGNVPNDSDCH